MANYGEFIKFENWEDASEELFKVLKLRGAEGASIYKNAEGKVEVSIVGKIGKNITDLLTLDSGEVVGDYEGIDDTTKKTGFVFPDTKCKKLLIDAFGFEGRWVQIPSEEQDPISGEFATELIYIPREMAEETVKSLICEQIEMAINIIDINDEKDMLATSLLEAMSNIVNLLGEKNLLAEVNDRLLDFA